MLKEVCKRVTKGASILGKSLLAFAMVMTGLTVTPPIQAEAVDLYNEATASVSLVSNITIPSLGKSTPVYNLSLDGTEAFCIDLGDRCTSGTKYARVDDSSAIDSDIIQVLNWYYSDIAKEEYSSSEVRRAITSGYIWADREGGDKVSVILDVIEQLDLEENLGIAGGFDQILAIMKLTTTVASIMGQPTTGNYYLYDCGKGGYQRLVSRETGSPVAFGGDETSATEKYTATEKVTVNLTKTDDETSNGLQNATFDFYRDNKKIGTKTTNASGRASISYSQDYTRSATVSATYYEGYDDLSIPNQGLIGDFDFSSKAEAKAWCREQALKKAKEAAQNAANQKHTYKAVETKTRTEYYLNPDKDTVTKSITGSGTVTMSLTNHRQEGTISIVKKDSETNNTVPNAIYKLYAKTNISHPDGHKGILYHAGDEVATFAATNSNGEASLSGLYLGNYYVKEYQAPNGYLLNTATYDVTLSYAGQNVSITDASTTVNDKVVRGQVEFTKVDKELDNGSQSASIVDGNGDGAQGDATRRNATYGLYARNNIVHKDTKTGVVTYNQTAGSINEIKLLKGSNLSVKNVQATAGTLLATAQTDANGQIEFGHLYLGDYYIKEISPSEGYLLNSETYNFSLTYAGQTVELVDATVKGTEQIKKQAFELQKFGHQTGQSGVAKPLQGAEFTVKLESDVQRLGWDNAPTYCTITTNSQGYGKSIELPYGTYRVRETKTPANYNTSQDFFVEITEDSRTPQHFSNKTVIDEEYSSLLKIVKTDAESGKTVQRGGATFRIKALTDVAVNGVKFEAGEYIKYTQWNPVPTVVDRWSTNDEGYIILQEKLGAGTYQLEEIASVDKYLISNTPLKFTISSDNFTSTETDVDATVAMTEVKFANQPVKGQIKVYKEGEVLDSYDEDFVYVVKGLANAQYQIIAKENIMDPANDGTIKYKAGDIVETVTTDASGNATSSKLYLGEYTVKEYKAPNGFVLNPQSQDVSLVYKDEVTAVVFDNASFENERQKVDIETVKKDADNQTPLKGAQFGIYAKENITNHEGAVIVEKGTLLQTVTTDENGKAQFTLDFPLEFDFEVKELKAPIGYSSNDATLTYSPTYAGQEKDKVSLSQDFFNEITKVEVSKSDITTGEELPGSTLAVYPVVDGEIQKGEAFDTWISTDKPHMIQGLEPGKEYALVELNPTTGYTTAETIYFTVEDTGEVQKVEMKNKLTETVVVKYDEDMNHVVGATMAIYPLDENNEPILGECFETWVTDGKAHTIYGLEINQKYLIRETVAPFDNGYVTAKDTIITVEDSLEPQYVYIEDEFTHIEVNKVDIETKDNLAGATLALYPILDNGEVDYGACFETWLTTDKTHTIDRIPVGKYLLMELSTIDGYTVAKPMIIEVKDTAETQTFELSNDFHKIEISKTNLHTNEYVEGATLAIVPVEDGEIQYGETYETWMTTDKAHRIDRIPEGEYAIVELSTPANSGYLKAEPVYITVKDTTEVQSFEMKDDYTKVEISKQDIVTGEEIKNAHLQIIDNETNEVVKEWVTNGEKTLIENVLQPNHDYTLVETSVDEKGYIKAEDVKFHVDETGEIQTVIMKDDFTKVEFSKEDITTGEEIEGAHLQIIDKETGDIITEWVTDGKPHYIENVLQPGQYYLEETSAPDGYLIAERVEFTVEETGDIQKVTMKDDYTKVEIMKHTDDNKILEGAQFEMTDKDGNVVATWTSGKEAFRIDRLTVGQEYTIREIKTPDGYTTMNPVTFTVQNTAKIQHISLFNKKEVIIKTGDDTNVGLYAGLAFVSMLGIAFAMKRKKESE